MSWDGTATQPENPAVDCRGWAFFFMRAIPQPAQEAHSLALTPVDTS